MYLNGSEIHLRQEQTIGYRPPKADKTDYLGRKDHVTRNANIVTLIAITLAIIVTAVVYVT